jgi:hypothetical protein
MFDLDRHQFDVPCPNCRFFNRIFYRDARLRDVVICRGCKQNIQLDDHMNECRKARAQLAKAFRDLERTLASMGGKLTIKL